MVADFSEASVLFDNTIAIGDALRAAFTTMGYGDPILDTGVNPRSLIYEIIKDINKTFGKIYLEIRVSSDGNFYINQRIGTEWDATNQVLINPGSWSESFVAGNPSTLAVRTFHTTEFQFVVLSFGEFSSWALLGVISPAAKPNYWDDDVAPYFFISNLDWAKPNNWLMAGINPFSNWWFYNPTISADFNESHYPNMGNPFNQEPDIIPQILFVPESRTGIAGLSSADFGRVGSSELGQGTIVQVGSQQYMVIGTTGASQPVIRVNLPSLEGRTVVNGALLPSIPTEGGNEGTICRFVNPPPYPTPAPCNYNALTVGQLFPR